MVNAKTAPYIVYFLVAAVILFALAAIIASRSGGTSAEIQYTTCTQFEEEHDFDVKAIITGFGLDTGDPLMTRTSDIRVSGLDVHIISTNEGEHIVKDGTFYTKPPGGTWEPPPTIFYGLPYVYSLINTRPYYQKTGSQYILCDREGTNKAKIGRYKERMVIGPEYIVGPNNEAGLSPEELAEVPNTNATWEYWIGSDGKIKKVKQTFAVVGGEDWQVRETMATISGVGEPNTITAPTMGSP